MRLTAGRALAGLALTLSLSACTPSQVSQWFEARGTPIDDEAAEGLSRHLEAEAALNEAADHAARTNGARGTCSEAGIFFAESGGDWLAHNPTSSASGGYQFLDSTWAGHRGYPSADAAPAWVQRERFLQLWAGGAGAGHWTESVC